MLCSLVPGSNKQSDCDAKYKKPNCTYSCLIGMALKYSLKGRMTVGIIYSYLQNRFPYFRNCPQKSWKNSIRHSLSLSKNFQRVGEKEVVARKGLQWEIIPTKREAVMKEVMCYECSSEGKYHEAPPACSPQQFTCSALVPTALGYVHASASRILNNNKIASQPMIPTSLTKQSIKTPHCPQGKSAMPHEPIHLQRFSSSTSDYTVSSKKSVFNFLYRGDCQSFTTPHTEQRLQTSPHPNQKDSIHVKKSMSTKKVDRAKRDALYFQALLKTVDKAIEAEYSEKESLALSIDEVFEVIESSSTRPSLWTTTRSKNCSQNSKQVKLKHKRKRDHDPTMEHGKKFKLHIEEAGGRYADNDLLLSKAEENFLLIELEKDAWKLGKSLGSYLNCATNGIRLSKL